VLGYGEFKGVFYTCRIRDVVVAKVQEKVHTEVLAKET
jgi:hypothetical protein